MIGTRAITEDLCRRLRRRFSGGGKIILFEVGNGAGFANSGWSDAIAMQTWPSKGLTVTGFEVKATRSDWLKELDRPAKNREWQDACHEWYIVAFPKIIQLPELPAPWGLLVPRGADGLRIAKRALCRVTEQVPIELLAATFRAAGSLQDKAIRLLKDQIHREISQQFEANVRSAEAAREDMARRLAKLKRALGSNWDSDKTLLARAQAIQAVDAKTLLRNLRIAKADLNACVDRIREAEHNLQEGSPDIAPPALRCRMVPTSPRAPLVSQTRGVRKKAPGFIPGALSWAGRDLNTADH